MGFAIARAARLAGAQVTLIAGPVHLPTPHGVARVDVESALQMQAALQPALQGADVLIAAAAVADWRAAEVAAQKMKKDGSGLPPPLRFVENPDLLAAAARKPGSYIAWALPPKAKTCWRTHKPSASAKACRCWRATSALPLSGAMTTRSC